MVRPIDCLDYSAFHSRDRGQSGSVQQSQHTAAVLRANLAQGFVPWAVLGRPPRTIGNGATRIPDVDFTFQPVRCTVHRAEARIPKYWLLSAARHTLAFLISNVDVCRELVPRTPNSLFPR